MYSSTFFASTSSGTLPRLASVECGLDQLR
jgi:hypothetical protein